MSRVLVQEGVPLPGDLAEMLGAIRFPTSCESARRVFQQNPDSETILFRANFNPGPCLSDLPALKKAGLISTGTDNLPERELRSRGIEISTGEGANANAVVDYVLQALLEGWHSGAFRREDGVGVIGRGRIGSGVVSLLEKMKIPVAWYDPFVSGGSSREKALSMGVATFHVPLTREGEHRTEHMLNENYFGVLPYVIQASRGEIWEENFYKTILGFGKLWAQDVFPVEPPPPSMIRRFSTPHIAGYSTRGRVGGLYRALQTFFPELLLPPMPAGEPWLLSRESDLLQKDVASFSERRNSFPWRKEFFEYTAQEQIEFMAFFPNYSETFFEPLWNPLRII